MDHTLQMLDQIKNDLLANTCNANEAKDRLFAIIGTPHNIVAQAIYDLQNTDCTNLYLHLEHEGQARKLMNLFEDFLAEDHKKSFNITRARFFELYQMITVDILDYSKHSYNFFDQAREEILNTDDVEQGLSKVRDELQELLYIVYDFSEIYKWLEDEIKSMCENTKRLQDQFKNNIDNRAKNHAQDIEIRFEKIMHIVWNILIRSKKY
jgi:hypothetical protein